MYKSRFVVVGLISMTLLGLELIWTRIFSAEFFYTFAFLTLSLAVMGLGLGALALRLFSFLDRERNLGVVEGIITLTGSIFGIAVGTAVVAGLIYRFSSYLALLAIGTLLILWKTDSKTKNEL